ncbi:MAG: hypothetical protein JWN52_2765 [Actinomycetia bacterium]|nr:hypothetical protein [Actinomycetes bacterium]
MLSSGAIRMSLIMLLIGGIAVGCGTSGGKPHARNPVATPTPTGPNQMHLPITVYAFTETQDAQYQQIRNRIIQACMGKFGFTYLPGLTDQREREIVEGRQQADSRRYGISDLAIARIYGYHLKPTSIVSGAPVTVNSLPLAERQILLGDRVGRSEPGGSKVLTHAGIQIPQGGCVGEADRVRDAATSRSDEHMLLQRIDKDNFTRSQSDSRVLAVFSRWSACMKSNGYSYADPFQAAGDPRWDPNHFGVSPNEIKIAITDIDCKLKTNLLGIEFAIESEYENLDIERNAEALGKMKAELALSTKKLEQLAVQYGA